MHNGGLLMKPACRDFRYRLSELVQTAFPICWAFQTGPALQPSVSIQPFLRSSTKIQPREIVLFFCNQPPTLPPLYHLGLRDCSTLLPASTTIPLRKVHYPIKIYFVTQSEERTLDWPTGMGGGISFRSYIFTLPKAFLTRAIRRQI